MISFSDFQKAELKVGKIISAERVENSEKLLKLSVDLGEDVPRQIIAGIGRVYAPEALVGTEITVVANLEPRVLAGLESQGMLLAAHGESGAPALIRPDASVPPGSSVS